MLNTWRLYHSSLLQSCSRNAPARRGACQMKRSYSKRSAAGLPAGALLPWLCISLRHLTCDCCRGYLTSVILGVAPESPCAFPPGWRRSTGLDVTGSARDPVDEAAIRLAFLGVPWQYAYHAYGACTSLCWLDCHDGGTRARVLRSESLAHSPCACAAFE